MMMKYFAVFVFISFVSCSIGDEIRPGLSEALQSLHLTKFLDDFESCKNELHLEEGTITIFAPNNDAYSSVDIKTEEKCNNILYHIAKGKLMEEDFQNDLILETLAAMKNIRINIYPLSNNVTIVNGVPVLSTNHLTQNAVVHVISKFIGNVSNTDYSVLMELAKFGYEFEDFLKVVEFSGIFDQLEGKGPFTLLAPNSESFTKLNAEQMANMESNFEVLKNLTLAHLIPETIYTAGIPQIMEVKNMLGDSITVKNINGTISFGEAKAVKTDLTATNGVVHIIDTILFPEVNDEFSSLASLDNTTTDERKNLFELLLDIPDSFIFTLAFVTAKLEQVLKLKAGPFMVITPGSQIDCNFGTCPSGPLFFNQMKYHVGLGVVQLGDVKDEDKLPTLLKERFIIFNVYEDAENENETRTVTANGCPVSPYPNDARNGMILLIHDCLLKQPYSINGTLEVEIGLISQFSTFLRLIAKNNLDLLNNERGSAVTVLIPDNEVLDKELETRTEEDVTNQLIKNHFIQRRLYTVGMNILKKLNSTGGTELNYGQPKDNHTNGFINGIPFAIETPYMDYTASNGIIHHITKLI